MPRKIDLDLFALIICDKEYKFSELLILHSSPVPY